MNSILIEGTDQVQDSSDLFEVKYSPKILEDFIENESAKKIIQEWKYDKFLIITGSTGSGKSVFSKIILKDFSVIEFNDSHTAKDVFEKMNDIKQINNIVSQLQGDHKSAILIENGEIIFNDVRYFDKFYALCSSFIPLIPIVVIFNGLLKKKFKKFKDVQIIELENVSLKGLVELSKRVIIQEKINISIDLIKEFAKVSKGDTRKFLQFLKFLTIKKYNTYDKEIVERIIQFGFSDSFFEASEIVRQIFHEGLKGTSIDEKIEICYEDQFLIEQLIYSNMAEIPIEKVSKIMDSFCLSDNITEFIVRDQHWNFKEYSVFLSCVYPDYIIDKKKVILKKNSINNLQLNVSKVREVYNSLRTDPTFIKYLELENVPFIKGITDPKYFEYLFREILSPYMIKNNTLIMEYETYSKFCNLFKIKKKSASYF